MEKEVLSADQDKGQGEFDLGQRQTVLGMKVFLCSESMFFLALIIAYIYFRAFSHSWGDVQRALDWRTAGVFTGFLVLSSLTLTLAVRCFEKAKKAPFVLWALATLGLGLAFLIHQMLEYRDLATNSITMDSSIFGSAFYTLTGFHTLHVAVGMVLLTIVFSLMAKEKLSRPSSGARAVEYYWHFVDVVWVVVYTVVYIGAVV